MSSANSKKDKSSSVPVAQARRNARIRALQGLYQNEFNPQPSRHIIEQLHASQEMAKTDVDYFAELLKNIIPNTENLDQLLSLHLDIPVQQLDAMERSILRIGVFELSEKPDIPYRVILNEAIGLSKKFGAAEGHKFVNGVLDKAAREIRPMEIQKE